MTRPCYLAGSTRSPRLLINNLLLKVPLFIGFPFYLAYLGVRRIVTGRRSEH